MCRGRHGADGEGGIALHAVGEMVGPRPPTGGRCYAEPRVDDTRDERRLAGRRDSVPGADLVFAGLRGVLLVAELPDPLTPLGMLMIALGGVLAVRGGHTGTGGEERVGE